MSSSQVSIVAATFVAASFSFTTLSQAQEQAPRQVLFSNVNIFNGVDSACFMECSGNKTCPVGQQCYNITGLGFYCV